MATPPSERAERAQKGVRMSPDRVRNWKRAFEKDFDVENPIYPKRIDLSMRQKNWIKRAWTWASTAILGMNEEVLPDAIFRYNEEKGVHYVPAVKPDLNHIRPVGESLRLDGNDGYNNPRNVVPISRRQHTGAGMPMSEAEDEIIIHPDSHRAFKEYGAWKKGGMKDPNPISKIHEEREKKTDRGEGYHDTAYDAHFTELADRVVTVYSSTHPKDKFPKHPKEKKKKEWDPVLMRWREE